MTFSVYIIVNIVDLKGYVGITGRTVERRFYSHVKAARNGQGWALHKAIRKYGPDMFSVETLATDLTRIEATEMEQELIRIHRTKAPAGYNLTDGGDGATGYRHTEEWKREITRRQTGRVQSVQAVERMRQALTGRKMSAAACESMRRAQIGRKHPVQVIQKMKASALIRWQVNPRITSLEEAERLRTLVKGIPKSQDHKDAIRAALKGVKKSEEHRRSLSIAAKLREQKKRDVKVAANKISQQMTPQPCCDT